MINLLEKVINCFSTYLTRLSYGVTEQDYELLYDAVLLLKNNLDEDRYIQYYYNNLQCPVAFKLVISEQALRMISHTLSTSEALLPSFS